MKQKRHHHPEGGRPWPPLPRLSRPTLRDRIEVLYEDPDLLVIEKAAGIVTYPVEGFEKDTAIQLIRQYWKFQGKENKHLYLIHRIDKDTSGLLVFAKTSLARSSLQDQFAGHSVVRQYVAATSGIPRKKSGTIRTMIGHDSRRRRAVSTRGKESITEYQVLKENHSLQRALISCKLYTGRTHQIRIHLSHIGTPVIGDRVYGRPQFSAQPLALHASTLGFIHPRTERPILFQTSLPESLRKLV
jgi:pseudouridine synthase, RluA family